LGFLLASNSPSSAAGITGMYYHTGPEELGLYDLTLPFPESEKQNKTKLVSVMHGKF
jgi:hypothetical protein